MRRLFVLLTRLDLADLILQVTVRRKQIQPAIQIEVEEEYAEFEFQPRWWSQPGRDGVIGELQFVPTRHI
jgi:hypothetical protein